MILHATSLVNPNHGDVERSISPSARRMNLETQFVSSREKIANHGRTRRRSFLLACLALVGIATWSLSLPSPAAAQAAAADPALAGLQVWNTHNCSMCHSGMGTGTKGEFAAPNLRESTLKADAIRETVA